MSWPRPAVAPKSSPTTAPTMASPKLMWRLARIQVMADGMMISVVSRRLAAPRMRALAIRFRSTSRTPWNALKKTTKNTSTTAVAALPQSDSPNMTANSEPSTTRGMALAPLMKGDSTSASTSMRPRRMPKTTPSAAPIRKPTTASCIVTAACTHRGPSAVPSVIHVQSRSTTPDGCPTKKGSTQFSRVDNSQLPSQRMVNATRSAWITSRRRRAAAARRADSSESIEALAAVGVASAPVAPSCVPTLSNGGAPPCALTSDRCCVLLTLITHQHLIAKLTPDGLVDLGKARLEPNLGDVARPRQVDGKRALHRSGTRRHDHHAIGKRDRFLEVVRHEDDRRRRRCPKREQLVFHQRARLHIQRGKRLVHQQDARVVDQALRQADAFAHPARELVRIAVFETRQAHPLDPLLGLLVGVSRGGAAIARSGSDVAQHCLPREDRVALEDVADAVGNAVDRLPGYQD